MEPCFTDACIEIAVLTHLALIVAHPRRHVRYHCGLFSRHCCSDSIGYRSSSSTELQLVQVRIPWAEVYENIANSYISGFMHLACGLSVGLTGLAAGYAIGIVGDMGVRSYMQQSRIFVGMVLILIFGEVLGLYGSVHSKRPETIN